MYSYLISLCSCQILYMIFAVKWLLIYCLFQGGASFVDRFCSFGFMLVCVVMLCLFFVAFWSSAGKGLTSWLSCVLCFVTFPNVSWSTSESRVRFAP